MKSQIRFVSIFLALALVLPALAQAGGTVPEGAKITVVTDQSVSSKTAKAGQTVTGSVAHDVISGGKVVIPKNSKLIGHVTEASAKANGQSDSKLGIVFDKAMLRNGSTVPMQARIQALAAPVVNAAGSLADDTAIGH